MTIIIYRSNMDEIFVSPLVSCQSVVMYTCPLCLHTIFLVFIWCVSYQFYFKDWNVLLYNNWFSFYNNVKEPGFLLLNIIIMSIPFLLLSPAVQLKFSGFVHLITREHFPTLPHLIIIVFDCVQVPASLQLWWQLWQVPLWSLGSKYT